MFDAFAHQFIENYDGVNIGDVGCEKVG